MVPCYYKISVTIAKISYIITIEHFPRENCMGGEK